MRLLIINPNTTQAISEDLAARAQRLAGPSVHVRAVTGRFGARYIASRAAAAIAAHAALDALAEHGGGVDAVYLACFGDPGLAALKELATVPVVGMAEASCLLASTLGARFGIVTGGERWGPMLREFVAAQGLSQRLAGIRTIAPTGGAIGRDPDAARSALVAACLACAHHDGADVVILGGAGLAGLAAGLADSVPVPLLCSFEAGLRAALACAALAPGKAQQGSLAAAVPVESVGLGEALAHRLAGR
jgi:Asp/Glu/hydantoin racemase